MNNSGEIRLAGVIKESIVDGPGIRYSVFVQGCPHKCENCHNPQTHDSEGGNIVKINALAESILKSGVKGITFSGGEPFLQAAELAATANLILAKRSVSIITYTGYTFEELLHMIKSDKGIHDLLSVTNYLIDGRYIHGQRNMSLRFRGSDNQRILDVTCYPNSILAQEMKII